MRMPFRKNKGFTLIEIIVSLLIASMMAALAGLGIVQITNAFVFAKDSAALTQTSQLAMTRLRMSLQNLTSININTAGASTITIERRGTDGTLITETFQLSGSTLQLKSSDYDGYKDFFTLADNVSAFALSYDDYSGSDWSTSNRLSDLARIDISMSLKTLEGTSITFVDAVFPSNTYVPKGFSGYSVSTGSTGTTTPCFVTAAGFEDWNAMTVAWYHKAGLIIIVLFGWILFVLLKRHWTFKDLKLSLPVGRSGSILIGVIITIVIIAVLGAAMVSLFSSSSTGT